MGVSWNGGSPIVKSSISNDRIFSNKNQPAIGDPHVWKPPYTSYPIKYLKYPTIIG